MKHLLDSNCSSKRVRPVENDADTVNVTMDMTLSNVIDMVRWCLVLVIHDMYIYLVISILIASVFKCYKLENTRLAEHTIYKAEQK